MYEQIEKILVLSTIEYVKWGKVEILLRCIRRNTHAGRDREKSYAENTEAST